MDETDEKDEKDKKGENEEMPEMVWGFYDDDGNKIDPTLVPRPGLCLICVHDDELDDEGLCAMNRWDQRDDKDFRCGQFEKK